jgi:hypothetical protein
MTSVRHLTTAELAERLHTTVQAVYAMNKRGTGPKRLRRGGRRGPLLYRLADVEVWEESRLEQ